MNKFNSLFSNRKHAELYNVEYQYLGEKNSHFNLEYVDVMSVLIADDEKLRVLVERQVKFNPENLFSIKASYFVDHFVKKNLIGKIDWKEYDVQREIEKDIDYFSMREWDRLSLIISQVTGSFSNSPVISPPIYHYNIDNA